MKLFKNLMMSLAGLIISIITGILVCIYGWGLEPKSWLWIILISFIGQMFASTLIVFAKD